MVLHTRVQLQNTRNDNRCPGCAYTPEGNDLFNIATDREPNLCRRKEVLVVNTLDSQSRLNLDDGSDLIGAVSIGDCGVFLAGVVAEQQHLFTVEGVFWPSYVGQQAGGGGTTRVVGVVMVDEVDW